MNDVWRSIDGANWELVTASADFPGRGGHQMLAMVSNVTNDASLWIFGGRGVDPTQPPGTNLCFNDMWTASLSNAYPSFWTQVSLPISGDDLNMSTSMPWTPRLGHTVTLETATASNGNFQTLHLVGGRDCSGNVLDEVWSWRTDDANSTWILDFTHEALYSTTYNGSFGYYTNSPLVNQYITPNSDVSLMQQYSVPSYPVFYPGVPLQRRVYLSDEKIAMLRSVGINTIQQFASADKYTILKLRGFDIPQVPLSARLHFNDVCNYRSLALNLVKKCSLTTAYDLYYDEKDMPWNVKNVFGGPPPSVPLAAWHGVDYNALYASAQPTTRDSLISSWDGCSPLPGFAQSGYAAPNVPGIGIVTQVAFIADSNLELENLGCRQTPGPRAHHAAVSFQGQLYIFGGKVSDTSLRADTWYRDSNLPSAFISTKPATRTSSSGFSFSADKSGCYFEYRIWRPADYELVREWTPVVYHTDVAWMDSRKGGPGKGLYAMYVRAIDPAGNRDVYFSEGKNVYTWVYVSPTPWDIIGGAIGAFFGLLFLVYFEYRRRRKKAAMERYALKRMRRKFKAMQKDADDKGVDWRTLYEESKQESAAVKRKKMLKRARDVNKERLDKDADRRDKEKEAIKIKMKEKREILRKRRLNDGGQYGFGERTDADLEVGKSAAILKLKSVAAEDLQGPSRLKKTREKRRKPGGYNESDYVEDENATGPALLGNGMVAGVVKRKAVASKRTKEFRLEDPMKDDGNKKQT